jgi:hypothetical protein
MIYAVTPRNREATSAPVDHLMCTSDETQDLNRVVVVNAQYTVAARTEDFKLCFLLGEASNIVAWSERFIISLPDSLGKMCALHVTALPQFKDGIGNVFALSSQAGPFRLNSRWARLCHSGCRHWERTALVQVL